MARGSWPNVADGRICGRSRGRSGSTCGNPGAGELAPEPVPAAAQRLPRFLWQPAASQNVSVIPPRLGRSLAIVGQASGRRQAEIFVKIGFTAEHTRSKDGFDEKKRFIRRRGASGYRPKMGGYPDLYNQLF